MQTLPTYCYTERDFCSAGWPARAGWMSGRHSRCSCCASRRAAAPPSRKQPRLAVFNGHSQAVWGCAFAPDGTRLASASFDNTLRLWDPVSGECLSVLRGHEGGVSGCAFAPDGTRLVSASADNTLRL
jgi:WD40 repeat protein